MGRGNNADDRIDLVRRIKPRPVAVSSFLSYYIYSIRFVDTNMWKWYMRVYIYIYLAIRHWWSHFPQVRIVFTICPCSSAHSSFRWKQKTPWYSDAIIGKCLFTYKNSQIIISNLFQRSTSKFEYPTVWIGILYRRKDCANDRQSGIPLTVDEMIMRRT